MPTQLSGIEKFSGRATIAMNLQGTDQAEQILISQARHVTIRSLGGNDRVRMSSDRWHGTVSVYAGRGADNVTLSVSGYLESTAHGGRGADLLRGLGRSDDRLYGGPGRDTAYGGPGQDICRAEVTRGCERP